MDGWASRWQVYARTPLRNDLLLDRATVVTLPRAEGDHLDPRLTGVLYNIRAVSTRSHPPHLGCLRHRPLLFAFEPRPSTNLPLLCLPFDTSSRPLLKTSKSPSRPTPRRSETTW